MKYSFRLYVLKRNNVTFFVFLATVEMHGQSRGNLVARAGLSLLKMLGL